MLNTVIINNFAWTGTTRRHVLLLAIHLNQRVRPSDMSCLVSSQIKTHFKWVKVFIAYCSVCALHHWYDCQKQLDTAWAIFYWYEPVRNSAHDGMTTSSIQFKKTDHRDVFSLSFPHLLCLYSTLCIKLSVAVRLSQESILPRCLSAHENISVIFLRTHWPQEVYDPYDSRKEQHQSRYSWVDLPCFYNSGP